MVTLYSECIVFYISLVWLRPPNCQDHFSLITDEQFGDEDIFHTRLFPSDFGFIWCFTYDPPDTSPSGGEGQASEDTIQAS